MPLRPVLAPLLAALALALGAPAASAQTDTTDGDAAVVPGNNIAEEKQQIRDEVLGCGAGGSAGAPLALALGALGAAALRRRRRPLPSRGSGSSPARRAP